MFDLSSVIAEYIERANSERRDFTKNDIAEFLRKGLFKSSYKFFLIESLSKFYQDNYKGKHKFDIWLNDRILERTKNGFGLVFDKEREFDLWIMESINYSLEKLNPQIESTLHFKEDTIPTKI